MSAIKTGRFADGERSRQKALNYIIANPGAVGPQISAAMGWRNDVTTPRLTRMMDNGDVERELTQYSYRNERGGLVNITTYAYTALRTKTRAAEEMREVMVENMLGTKRAQAINTMREGLQPGVIRNIDPDRKPIPNQGGQGATRRMVHIGSSL
jgi:hypothetical protein